MLNKRSQNKSGGKRKRKRRRRMKISLNHQIRFKILFVSLGCQEHHRSNVRKLCVLCLHAVSQFHFGQMPINYFLFLFNKFHSYLRCTSMWRPCMCMCSVYAGTIIVLTIIFFSPSLSSSLSFSYPFWIVQHNYYINPIIGQNNREKNK